MLLKPRGRAGAALRGFTLLELAIAMSILMVGLVSAAAATTRMHDLRRQSRERVVAQNAIRSMAERIHAQSYRLSANPDTWSRELLEIFGPGGTFGTEFDVTFLTSQVDDAPPGSIQVVVDETATDAELGVDLGMPRDLNGDGDASDVDVTLGARILPVVLTIAWKGASGDQTIRHGIYVMGY
jgi:Tfp pilus assembly protein PilV